MRHAVAQRDALKYEEQQRNKATRDQRMKRRQHMKEVALRVEFGDDYKDTIETERIEVSANLVTFLTEKFCSLTFHRTTPSLRVATKNTYESISLPWDILRVWQ